MHGAQQVADAHRRRDGRSERNLVRDRGQHEQDRLRGQGACAERGGDEPDNFPGPPFRGQADQARRAEGDAGAQRRRIPHVA